MFKMLKVKYANMINTLKSKLKTAEFISEAGAST